MNPADVLLTLLALHELLRELAAAQITASTF
jgi:hypothetical protein